MSKVETIETTVAEESAFKSLSKRATAIRRKLSTIESNKRAIGEMLIAVRESGDLEVAGMSRNKFVIDNFSGTLTEAMATECEKYAFFTPALEAAKVTGAAKFASSVYRGVPVDAPESDVVKAAEAILEAGEKVTQARMAKAFRTESDSTPSEPEAEATETSDSELWSNAGNTMLELLKEGFKPSANQRKQLEAILKATK